MKSYSATSLSSLVATCVAAIASPAVAVTQVFVGELTEGFIYHTESAINVIGEARVLRRLETFPMTVEVHADISPARVEIQKIRWNVGTLPAADLTDSASWNIGLNVPAFDLALEWTPERFGQSPFVMTSFVDTMGLTFEILRPDLGDTNATLNPIVFEAEASSFFGSASFMDELEFMGNGSESYLTQISLGPNGMPFQLDFLNMSVTTFFARATGNEQVPPSSDSLGWNMFLARTSTPSSRITVPLTLVPEPTTGLLFAMGLVGLAVRQRQSN